MAQQAEQRTPSHREAEYIWRVRDYKRRVSILYPEIPHQLLENCSIFSVDALVVGYFLEGLDLRPTVYEVGSFVGVSSYIFATHPKVHNLICIDPNPTIADEATANSEWARRLDLASLGDLRVLEVAREALSSLDERAFDKVEFKEGVVGSESLGAKTERKWRSERIEIPEVGNSGDRLLAYIDGLHTREGVKNDLEAVFKRNPNAIAILDDCRHAWGAFVQAGAVDFMEQRRSEGEYIFRLFADLGPGVAGSNLGLLYPSDRSREIDYAMRNLATKFSRKLDPLELLLRENELLLEVNRRATRLSKAQKTIKQLQRENESIERLRKENESIERLRKENELLVKTLKRRSHKAAETLASSAQKIPGLRSLIRREP